MPEIAAAINQDYEHEIGLAVIAGPSRGMGLAVVNAASGKTLAWDGGYGLPFAQESPHLVPLVELDAWTDSDLMVSQATQERSGAWLQALAHDLMPSYSIDEKAKSELRSWSHDHENTGEGWAVVAYFPTRVTLAEATEIARDNA